MVPVSKDLDVPADRLRNVILLGHNGTGKTTLAEALLEAAGVIGRRGSTTAGTAALDFEPEEQGRHHSLSLGVAAIPWKGHRINLLDAPGGPEAYGDSYPALHAADVAVFVVDATAGVQPQHDELWDACGAIGLPRVVFLNKLDKAGAAFQRNIDELRERYGKPLAAMEMPIGIESEFTGVIDLLHFRAVELVDGRRVEADVPGERREQAERNRELLVEAIVENDDELLMRYLDGEVPDAKELAEVFHRGIATNNFFPVLCGSAELGIGVQMLADFILEECPSPDEEAEVHGVPADSDTAVAVVKTFSDPYVGRINVLRVLSGGLSADDTLTDVRTGKDVRLHQIFLLQGKDQLPITSAPAGDVIAVAKLDDVVTGDLLTTRGSELPAFEPTVAPDPYFRVALEAATSGDEDKLSTALQRMVEEDPSLRIERDAVTNQLVLCAYGPTHVDTTTKRLQRKFGVSVSHSRPRIAYRETLKGTAQGLGRHVKQSGGHGQYGIAHIEAEPLPRGSGFVFEDAIVGGVIPNQYIPSVEKGIVDRMQRGVLAGYPVIDVKVRLFDGKHHSVDSSDMAFQMAGSLAFQDACENIGLKLLEPILEVDVSIPDELTGDVMGDISSRRGRIQGSDPAGAGRSMIHALVPEAEMLTYVAELRALTSGRGSVAMRYSHHEDVPDHIAQKVIAEHEELAPA